MKSETIDYKIVDTYLESKDTHGKIWTLKKTWVFDKWKKMELVIWLVEQLIVKPFCDNFIFWSSLFSEIGPIFVDSWSSDHKNN